MGCGPSRPPPENGFQLEQKRAVFRPPPDPETEHDMKFSLKNPFSSNSNGNGITRSRRPEQVPSNYTSQNRAKEVARCATLLREMYTLDLEIWAMGNAHVEDVPEREMKKRKANALFGEIKRIVAGWRASGEFAWEEDEWQNVDYICKAVDQHGDRRY